MKLEFFQVATPFLPAPKFNMSNKYPLQGLPAHKVLADTP